MFNWFFRWYNARRRRIDIEILWPLLRARAESVIDAREAFLIHACIDCAWTALPYEERIKIIERLT
jgi:hypothetical protein